MAKKKVLYVCHNHQSVRPGGTEAYALELYRAMQRSDDFEAVLLARSGPPVSPTRRTHAGTLLETVDGDPNQYFFYVHEFGFDGFYGSATDKQLYTRFFDEFLRSVRPDVVHFQHTWFLGYDLIRQTRTTLPDAAIVYTLHEFLPICHRSGQMVRTLNDELCDAESPRRCHECFPSISPQAFFMRKRFIQSHFALVDQFLTPSEFLRERYIAWGIPSEKIRYEPNGRQLVAPPGNEPVEQRRRARLGFFGQLTKFKGVDVLLQAMTLVAERDAELRRMAPSGRTALAGAAPSGAEALPRRQEDVHLWVHGSNLDLQSGEFQSEFRRLIDETSRHVTLGGRYEMSELPTLMANVDWVVMPSIWWENSPLVIQEAFQYGRPVICSDIGGMAEKVTDGVNGLHFRVADARSLAETIRRAVDTPGLWERLRAGIPPVYSVDQHVTALSDLYDDILARRDLAA